MGTEAPTGNGWPEWQRHVLATMQANSDNIKTIGTKVESVGKDVQDLRGDFREHCATSEAVEKELSATRAANAKIRVAYIMAFGAIIASVITALVKLVGG